MRQKRVAPPPSRVLGGVPRITLRFQPVTALGTPRPRVFERRAASVMAALWVSGAASWSSEPPAKGLIHDPPEASHTVTWVPGKVHGRGSSPKSRTCSPPAKPPPRRFLRRCCSGWLPEWVTGCMASGGFGGLIRAEKIPSF